MDKITQLTAVPEMPEFEAIPLPDETARKNHSIAEIIDLISERVYANVTERLRAELAVGDVVTVTLDGVTTQYRITGVTPGNPTPTYELGPTEMT